ncbi:Hypothetical_protein [Hexamita inflata]|uniref:Hypothetical_protein n=1 Tax=Hexamita inflata TaxID=28002 RepID=A0AA86U8X4_9EUKA|nr:Hypothetical protein HINF_LOCUS21438 [Hexamita inflata]
MSVYLCYKRTVFECLNLVLVQTHPVNVTFAFVRFEALLLALVFIYYSNKHISLPCLVSFVLSSLLVICFESRRGEPKCRLSLCFHSSSQSVVEYFAPDSAANFWAKL